MAEIEWVKERFSCSAAAVFGRLLAKTKTDVDERNEQRADGDAYAFQFKELSRDEFLVVREGRAMRTQSVSFIHADGTIYVESSAQADVAVKFTATVALDDAGLCRLKVGDQLLDEWQVRKRGLESLFFYVYGKTL